MKVASIKLNGEDRLVFVFGKWPATVFAAFGRNKRAPADEQAVRFAVYDGRPVVWATDGHALVMVESDQQVPHALTTSTNVLASSLKSLVQKARVNQTVLISHHPAEVHVVSADLEIEDGMEVDATLIGELDHAGPCSFGHVEFREVQSMITDDHSTGAPAWLMSSRFAALFAAVAKATDDADAWCLNPPSGDGPLVVQVAEWSIVMMPRDAPT